LTDPVDLSVKQALLKSIESRWSKAEQDVFIAAVILNPTLKLAPFNTTNRTRIFSLASILALCSRLYTRFYGGPEPAELHSNLRDYFDNQGIFVDLPSYMDTIIKEATAKVSLTSLKITRELICNPLASNSPQILA
jgi:hypothetical protein